MSLKPPKWLRKLQPGKILTNAAKAIPGIGGVIASLGGALADAGKEIKGAVSGAGGPITQAASAAAQDVSQTKGYVLIGVGIVALIGIIILLRK